MLDIDLDATNSILLVRPEGPFDKEDFAQLAEVADPQIEAAGQLNGFIVDARSFPGWDSFGTFISHIKFIRDHHRHVKKVALVTDSPVAGVAEHVAAHFISAEIKHFPGGDVAAARAWVTGTPA